MAATETDQTLLARLFHSAVAAALPGQRISAHLPARPKGRTIVVGAGKAAAQMAAAFEDVWGRPDSGLVVTRYGHACPTRWIEVAEAAHPVPDAAGLIAAERMLDLVKGLGPEDLVIALVSGGGSALLPAPAAGLTLDDEIEVTRALLAGGVPIGAMNRIRNELSRIKGGRLALAASPARVVTLVISDVPGDDPALVASGPTVAASGSREEARALIRDYGLILPKAAQRLLDGADNPAPRVDDPRLSGNLVKVIASAALSLDAAARTASQAGLTAHILSDAIEGESREAARTHAAIALEVGRRNRPFQKPAVILSGGETSVTVRGRGRGGRNAEFLLSFALAIDGQGGITALAADTDGIDGTEDNAGAFVDGTTIARMRAKGIDPKAALANNDAYTAFAAIGDPFVTGPTGTNVNDFRAILIR